jgi:hypothetical protein
MKCNSLLQTSTPRLIAVEMSKKEAAVRQFQNRSQSRAAAYSCNGNAVQVVL